MRIKKWIGAMFVVLSLSSCVHETVVVNDLLITDADLYYDYTADNWGVLLEGELVNDGETPIDNIQLEVRLYDRRGYILDYEYIWVETYFRPGQVVPFSVDLPYRDVYDVEVFIHRYD